MHNLNIQNKYYPKIWIHESIPQGNFKPRKNTSFIYDIFKKIDFQKVVGKIIAKKLLFVKNENCNYLSNLPIRKYLLDNAQAEHFKITAQNDSIELDGMVIHSKTISNKFIVVFNGLNDRYDNHILALKKLADDTGANVVSFDYRSVGKSQGKMYSKNDLIEDGKIILDFVKKNKKVSEENILLYGHSLGGGVAAELHAHVKHKGALVSEASFSSFSAVVKSRKGGMLGLLVKLSNWDFKAVGPFQQASKKGLIVTHRDPVVPHYTSLYKNLKKENKALKNPGSYHVIKIGKKPQKEKLLPHVKYIMETPPILSRTAVQSTAKKQPTDSEFEKRMQEIKKRRLFKYLPFPHDRVMDRVTYFKPMNSNHVSANVLQKKFREEDLAAYRHSVDMLKRLLA